MATSICRTDLLPVAHRGIVPDRLADAAGLRMLTGVITLASSPQALPAYTLMLVTRASYHPFDVSHLLPPAVRLPSGPQPGGRDPAPDDLSLVQAFANTFWDLDHRRPERLTSPSALAAWLAERGLLQPGVAIDEAELERAIQARDGLRALMFVNNGAPADLDAIEQLNRRLRGPGLFVQLHPDRPPTLGTQRRDLDSALALIATIVAIAQIDGRWARLKACRGDHCGWAFYDHSRNQNGHWCAMAVCGSRAKARDYRTRKRRSDAARTRPAARKAQTGTSQNTPER